MSRRHKEETGLIDPVPESPDGCSGHIKHITISEKSLLDVLKDIWNIKHDIPSDAVTVLLGGSTRFSQFCERFVEENINGILDYIPTGGEPLKLYEVPIALRIKKAYEELRQEEEAIRERKSLQEQVKEALSTKHFFKRIFDNEAQRGRPRIERLCPHFEDEEIVPLLKKTFKRYYKYAIERAKHLTQYLTCFVCAFFDLIQTETVDGRVAHFWRIVKNKIKKGIPSVRTLQDKVRWLLNWDRIFSKNKNPDKEEAKHNAWMELQKRILDILLELNPQFAF